MADYDVGVTGLSVPPSSATLVTYRPTVLVRNNGIHHALAYGTLRIYTAGRLVFSTNVYSGTIAPGETKPAQADTYWTPGIVGTYQVIATVTCNLDQYKPNDQLAPTFITVTAAPPPPTPPVEPHAAQHEEGGADEVNIDGLAGQTQEAQRPAVHATDHENGGQDEIDVTDLSGVLATAQLAEMHDNDRHTIEYAQFEQIEAQVEAHNLLLSPHPNATSLELTAHKGVAGGYAALGQLGDPDEGQIRDAAGNVAETTNNKDQPGGYAGLDDTSKVPQATAPRTSGARIASVSDTLGDKGELTRLSIAPNLCAAPTNFELTAFGTLVIDDYDPLAKVTLIQTDESGDNVLISGAELAVIPSGIPSGLIYFNTTIRIARDPNTPNPTILLHSQYASVLTPPRQLGATLISRLSPFALHLDVENIFSCRLSLTNCHLTNVAATGSITAESATG
jgi:hypothetical protein